MTDPSDRDEVATETNPAPEPPAARIDTSGVSVVEAILRLEAALATGLADLADAIRVHAQATRDAAR